MNILAHKVPFCQKADCQNKYLFLPFVAFSYSYFPTDQPLIRLHSSTWKPIVQLCNTLGMGRVQKKIGLVSPSPKYMSFPPNLLSGNVAKRGNKICTPKSHSFSEDRSVYWLVHPFNTMWALKPNCLQEQHLKRFLK